MEELKVTFKFANFGNIACLHVVGSKIQNDINNEEAIILFNSLVGCKDRNLNLLIKENTQLRKTQGEVIKLTEYYISNRKSAIKYYQEIICKDNIPSDEETAIYEQHNLVVKDLEEIKSMLVGDTNNG